MEKQPEVVATIRMTTKPKCEDIGFAHFWVDTTPGYCIQTLGKSLALHPAEKRRCFNCGKEQVKKVIQERVEEWQDVEKNENSNLYFK